MIEKKDHCTWFPETWIRWKKLYKWELFDISECCEIHDEKCSSTDFAKCLLKKRAVFGTWIWLGGLLGCVVKYPSKMIKKVF